MARRVALLRTRTARASIVLVSVIAAVSVGGGFLAGALLATLLVVLARHLSLIHI